MAMYLGMSKLKFFIGNKKVKKMYIGNEKIYSSGNVCIYHCNDTTYTIEYDEGSDVLHQTTFIPTMHGWEFVGWRQDDITSLDVETDLVMGETPIELYAVFKCKVTLTTYISYTEYYEYSAYKIKNVLGNTITPTINAPNPTLEGASFIGWSGSSTNTNIVSQSITNMVLYTSVSVYAVFMYENVVLLTNQHFSYGATYNGGYSNELLIADGKKFSEISFVGIATSGTVGKWATYTSGYTYISDGNTIVKLREYTWTTEFGDDYYIETDTCPCYNGQTANISIPLQKSDTTIIVGCDGYLYNSNISIQNIEAIGRTVNLYNETK